VKNSLIIFFLILSISTETLAVWELPNTPMGGIGDPGSFYLNQQGLTLHLFNNDYVGYTDKLNTASGSLFLYLQPNKNHGWEVSAHRRLFTPIIRTKFGTEPAFDPPRGIYADQLESKVAYTYVDGHLKYEASFSAEYYAGLGGDDVAQFIHKVIGAHDDTDKYGPKFDDNLVSGILGMGFLTEYALFMVYIRESSLMRDATARLSLKFGKDYQFGFQGEVSQQFKSQFYGEEIENYRYGYGLSYKHGWYQFTANYVSVYLKYDRFGQYYLSPIVISYEW
jgi:hypothetical protein